MRLATMERAVRSLLDAPDVQRNGEEFGCRREAKRGSHGLFAVRGCSRRARQNLRRETTREKNGALGALATVALLTGCANGERDLKQAWDEAIETHQRQSQTPGQDAEEDQPGQREEQEQDIGDFLNNIHGRLAEGVGAMSLPALLEAICDGSYDEASGEAVGYHCVPSPPQELGTTVLTVEVSPTGVVSLAADDLSETVARKLVRHGLEIVRPMCEGKKIKPVDRAQNADEDFHSCLTADAVTVVVGRFKVSPDSQQWRFSLALLGPG